MKASINTATGLLIESQSDDAALISNAVAIGIPADSVQIRVVTDAELEALIAARTASQMTPMQAKQSAYAAIDVQAGITREKYMTNIAGQDATYLSKAQDATAYKAAGYPSASIATYPWVQAESKALYGSTPTAAQCQAAADGILTTQTQWGGSLGPAIEQQRRAGKIAVGNAATVTDVQAAQAAAIAALKAL